MGYKKSHVFENIVFKYIENYQNPEFEYMHNIVYYYIKALGRTTKLRQL